jgi:hypothetical protein
MIKKSKGFGQSTHSPKALKKLEQKIRKGGFSDQIETLVASPKGVAKMSEVLEEFVAPYLGHTRNHGEREKLFSIAIVAWNLSLMPEDERQQAIDQVLAGQSVLARQDTQEILDEMIARKQQYFTDNERLIVDFELQDRRNDWQLSVASTLKNQSQQ